MAALTALPTVEDKEDIEWLFLCKRVIRTIRSDPYSKSNSSCFTLYLVINDISNNSFSQGKTT